MKLVFSSQNSQYEPLSKSYHFRLKETFNSGKKFTIHGRRPRPNSTNPDLKLARIMM